MQETGKEIIAKNGRIFAIVIRSTFRPNGVNFMTPDDYTLQLGLLGHDLPRKIKDHIHNPAIKYKVDTTQEFIYVERGKVKAVIYDMDWSTVREVVLNKGDIILHVYGGHGFEILEPSYLIEIKQGPFPGERIMKLYRDQNNHE